MPRISVILPAYNEELAIAGVIDEIRAVVPDADIIVVNDGSTDKTAEIAQAAAVVTLHHGLPLGAGRSIKDGIIRASGDLIVMMDADGTYPADRIPELVRMLEGGYDLVVGARTGRYYWGSPFKVIARLIFRTISEFATGKRIQDINSGMRAFRKSQITEYFPHLCNGFSLPTTMTLAYFFTGKMVTYLPIDYRKRIGHSKVRIFRDSLRTLQYITESVVYFNPIKLFLLLSLIVFIVGTSTAWWMRSPGAFIGIFSVTMLIFAMGLLAQSQRRR